MNMNPLGNHNFAAVLPGDSVAGLVVVNGIMSFLNIYNTLLIVRLVLTWFPNSPPAIVSPLRYSTVRKFLVNKLLLKCPAFGYDSFIIRMLCYVFVQHIV